MQIHITNTATYHKYRHKYIYKFTVQNTDNVQVNEVDGRVTYSDGFSLDPNILGLVIVSSALGIAIAK